MFNSAEWSLIVINILLASFAYLWLYPRIVQNDIDKILKYDLFVSLVSILIAALLFYKSGYIFHIFGMETSWFWFSLVSYFIIETPFVLWYFKKYDMWGKM